MMEAIISLGSNLGDLEGNLKAAVEALIVLGYELVRCSSVYETEAVGYASENRFYNAVILVRTAKGAKQVLQDLLDTERSLGRIRSIKGYNDRIIDLDLIDYSKLAISDEVLTLPHPRYHERLFVLVPLREICPDWENLSTGATIDEMIKGLKNQDFRLKKNLDICSKSG